jgi:hypothetical protein
VRHLVFGEARRSPMNTMHHNYMSIRRNSKVSTIEDTLVEEETRKMYQAGIGSCTKVFVRHVMLFDFG